MSGLHSPGTDGPGDEVTRLPATMIRSPHASRRIRQRDATVIDTVKGTNANFIDQMNPLLWPGGGAASSRRSKKKRAAARAQQERPPGPTRPRAAVLRGAGCPTKCNPYDYNWPSAFSPRALRRPRPSAHCGHSVGNEERTRREGACPGAQGNVRTPFSRRFALRSLTSRARTLRLTGNARSNTGNGAKMLHICTWRREKGTRCRWRHERRAPRTRSRWDGGTTDGHENEASWGDGGIPSVPTTARYTLQERWARVAGGSVAGA